MPKGLLWCILSIVGGKNFKVLKYSMPTIWKNIVFPLSALVCNSKKEPHYGLHKKYSWETFMDWAKAKIGVK